MQLCVGTAKTNMDGYEILKQSILTLRREVNTQHKEIINPKARLAALEHFVNRAFLEVSKFVAYGSEQPKKIGIPL